jgi:hypothetical protein
MLAGTADLTLSENMSGNTKSPETFSQTFTAALTAGNGAKAGPIQQNDAAIDASSGQIQQIRQPLCFATGCNDYQRAAPPDDLAEIA